MPFQELSKRKRKDVKVEDINMQDLQVKESGREVLKGVVDAAVLGCVKFVSYFYPATS